ncbi:MAG: Peptidoglycan D,D-transpeptidase MrdA [uncultured Solirubrobacteraceae bacterium]|uniref:Peptidoglycan D,D-transpeptidase MrdA n=1 Tax=uncultured Solirubrobacteraceae bacterium TaxID=1162706 RepID=A0A6J4SW48_9ACTN|nr:MAG: Peptidoglycan D,D-transpeptidase MrdA [uncultured Solirubrobacteraceae bacterium]
MMMEPTGDRRTPITPQLALRVALLGGVALALFAVVFFRLWYLQVLSGDKYLAEARVNRVRELRIQAPRGKIVDRNGRVIVRNRQAVVVELDPAKLPDEERENAAEWGKRAGERLARPKGKRGEPIPYPPIANRALEVRYRNLGAVVGKSARRIHREVVRSLVLVPYSAIRIKTDVPESVLAHISERPERFAGVKVEKTYLRDYPHDTLAAQILGTVGEITPKQLKDPRYRGVQQGTVIGTDGLEREYDRYLRGVDGVERVQVDAFGRPVPNSALKREEPIGGQRLRLSLDLALQKTGQLALGNIGGGRPGAFVALDPRDGQVLGMGSYPTFDPAVLTKPFTQKRYEQLTGVGGVGPLFNRAISGRYPTGSTFKAITALAGLEKGLITPGAVIDDAGCIQVGEIERCNAKKQAYGSVDLSRALQVSSDIYFYKLGINAFYNDGDRGDVVIQRYARKLGFGRPTGIDLPGEDSGVVPDKKWRAERNQAEIECRKEKKIPQSLNVYAAGAQGCGIADGRPYNLGDTVNVAIGQGDLQATPLQLAVSYAAIANKGRVVVPHLGREIERANGELVQRIERDPASRIKMDEEDRQAVADGLRRAAGEPGGTSADVFAGWPHGELPVFGKTGTAQTSKGDQSWYVAYVPAKQPIVVAVTVERGGFGAETAAPIACRMLAKFYRVENAACVGGESVTR